MIRSAGYKLAAWNRRGDERVRYRYTVGEEKPAKEHFARLIADKWDNVELLLVSESVIASHPEPVEVFPQIDPNTLPSPARVA